MIFWCFTITLFYVCANVISSPAIPCKLTDLKCFEKSGPTLFAKFIHGNPSIGTEDLDPIHNEVIEGNLPNLKYKLTDTTIEGLKKCKIENVKLNTAVLGLNGDIVCESLKIYGIYDLKGRVSSFPAEGNGDYSIISKTYRIGTEVDLKIAQDKDGKSYVAVKSFRLEPKALEPVVFEFKNLFNGQKDLSEALHKFMNENSEVVADEIQKPVFNAVFKKIIKNANKLLKSIPLENLFQN